MPPATALDSASGTSPVVFTECIKRRAPSAGVGDDTQNPDRKERLMSTGTFAHVK